MKPVLTRTIAALAFTTIALFSTLSTQDVHALTPQTASGIAYITGGVTIDERQEMMAQRNNYSLLLKVAAKSGKYLGDSVVKITDQAGATVFECTTDGPWLLVDLPVGRYTVSATGLEITQSQKILISKRTRREITMYWNVEER